MKKIVAFISVLVMLFSCVPLQAFATDGVAGTPTLTIGSPYAAAGQTVSVDVTISENVGIFGAILTFEFPSELTLTGVTEGDAFEGLDISFPDALTSPFTVVCDGMDAPATADGTIFTFNFLVAEDATPNSKLELTASYLDGDVVDGDFKDLELNIESGYVSIIDYIPGDVNKDKRVNTIDITWVRRFRMGGYDLGVFNEAAADVNDDGRINTIDITLIRRFRMGYDVILKPSTPRCAHTMTAFARVDATCTTEGNEAYWYCDLCGKYYSDEAGQTEISKSDTVIPYGHPLTHVDAKVATYTSEGCIEHWQCELCGKYYGDASAAQELTRDEVIIPIIVREESTVVYNVYGSDPYLESVGVDNSMNPTVFYSEDGLILNDIIAPAGYIFKGWTTAAGVAVTEIAPSTVSRQIVLNATWAKVEYTITFDSPDVEVAAVKYTVDTGATLKNPVCYGYTFVGWSNDSGFLVNSVRPGTTGNMRLHANWTSNRNRATSYSDYGEPIIIEDDNNGQFLFVYDIGRIDNVPLYPYIDSATNTTIGANGTALNIDMTYEVKEQFQETEAKEIIKTVADATTRSSGWTLSEEWSEIYEEGSEYADKQVKSEERVDSQGSVVGGNYFVSNSQGGSSFLSTESGGSFANSSKVTTDNSFGINTSYDQSTEKYCDAKLGVTNETEVSAGVEIPVEIVKVSAGVKNTTTVSAEASSGRKDNEAYHVDTSASSYIGTVDNTDVSAHYNTIANQSSNWNSTSGYEKSYSSSIDSSISTAIAKEIQETTSYNISKSLNGGSEHNTAVSGTTSSEQGYSNSIQVSEYHSKSTTKHVKYSNPDIGYYRVVMAGTIHVYGVVGYDVATASYYTYTFNVLEDDTFEYVDYSKERATFDDCENGIVAFEIPYEVNEYVMGVVGETGGLEIGLDGTVNGFDAPADFEGTVVVPQYHAETQPGTENIAIKTKAISAGAFQNNTEIETVILPIYVTEIPDNAFAGCTNLKTVIAYGVTKIGENAFKDCKSLEKFCIDNYVTELGANAFENVGEIAVMAHDSKVADAAIASGAINITVDISKITDSYNNKKVVVNEGTNSFAIIGNGGEYVNLQIESHAKTTLISKMKFVNNTDTPMVLTSSEVTLSVVSVNNCPVYALQLGGDNTDLKLYGDINLNSASENTVISKNVTLSKAVTSITSKMNVSGKYLVCGEVVNYETYLNVEPTTISADEYDVFTSPCAVSFNANGGQAVDTTIVVYKGQKYGELPIPQRQYYEFLGWYAQAQDSELITADSEVQVTGSQTLYAHWKQLTSNLIFNANGGAVSTAKKLIYIGEPVGGLPTPTRDYYSFKGWYTAASGGEKVTASTVIDQTSDVTVYAQWTLNPVSGWVKASELPAGAQVVSTKWSYTLRDFKESSASTLDGYTKYDTKRTSWGATQGPVYSDPSNGSRNVWSEQYVASTTKHYKYYHRTDGRLWGTDATAPGWARHNIDLTYALTAGYYSSEYGIQYYKTYKCGTCGNDHMWIPDGTYTVENKATRWYYQEPVYTYYYYKDLAKETTASNPTGQANVSNVVEWVQYRAK